MTRTSSTTKPKHDANDVDDTTGVVDGRTGTSISPRDVLMISSFECNAAIDCLAACCYAMNVIDLKNT